jgi:hypothetical protein|tara:strand:+ start:2385 stop:2903 length:519 start_codon:yes stop_codon:yes gene_type:complete
MEDYQASPYLSRLAGNDLYKKQEPVDTYDDLEFNITSLNNEKVDTVDDSVAYAEDSNERAMAMQKRNQGRYGITLTGAEQKEESRLSQLGGQSNVAGASTNAMRSDADINSKKTDAMTSLLSNFYNSSLSNLLGLEGFQTARQNAYQKDRGAARSQYYGFLGKVGSTLGSLL